MASHNHLAASCLHEGGAKGAEALISPCVAVFALSLVIPRANGGERKERSERGKERRVEVVSQNDI